MKEIQTLNESIVNKVSDEYSLYKGRERALADKYLSEAFLWSPEKRQIKKVAMFYYRLSIGGAQRVIALLTPMFIELGYEVTFITESVEEDFAYNLPEGVRIVTIPSETSVLGTGNYCVRARKLQEIIN